MKNIVKTIILTMVVAAFCTTVQAQSQYKTDVSIKEQIKKGMVPGQKFAPVTTQLQTKREEPAPEASVKEKFSTRLKNGSLPGMRIAPGGSTAFKAKAPAVQKVSNVSLASAVPAKKEDKAPAVVKPVTLPTQDAPAAKQ